MTTYQTKWEIRGFTPSEVENKAIMSILKHHKQPTVYDIYDVQTLGNTQIWYYTLHDSEDVCISKGTITMILNTPKAIITLETV